MDDTASDTAEIIPYLFYRDVAMALEWLSAHFGLREILRVPTPNGGMHGEMAMGSARIMLGASRASLALRTPAELGAATQGVFIYLRGVAGHYAHTVAAGARTDGAPTDHGYGLTYTAYDLDGHPWYFTEAAP